MKRDNSVAIIATAVVACVALCAVVALVAIAPKDADVSVLIGAMMLGAGSMLTSILNLVKTDNVAGDVAHVKGTVDELANGKMDAKIRASTADVLPDHLIDPKIKPQLVRDRAVRDAQHDAHHDPNVDA